MTPLIRSIEDFRTEGKIAQTIGALIWVACAVLPFVQPPKNNEGLILFLMGAGAWAYGRLSLRFAIPLEMIAMSVGQASGRLAAGKPDESPQPSPQPS